MITAKPFSPARKPKPDFSWEELDQLRVQAAVGDEQVPPGAFALRDYAEHYRLSRRTAQNQLTRMHELGLLNRGRIRRIATDGSRRHVFAYWPKE